MGKVYITITGMKHYFGQDFLKPGMKIELIKEPDNEFDKEAIRAEIKGIGKIGYVANSPYTVFGESMSAGRIMTRSEKRHLPRWYTCSITESSAKSEKRI